VVKARTAYTNLSTPTVRVLALAYCRRTPMNLFKVPFTCLLFLNVTFSAGIFVNDATSNKQI